jgi:hypothetical protein
VVVTRPDADHKVRAYVTPPRPAVTSSAPA